MDKKREEQVETKTEGKSKKHKAFKIIIWTLLIVITLGVAAFIILNILITDKNKNTFVDGGLSNQQIIEKEYVQGLSLTNESFEFKLSLNDVNQMLTNSLKSEEVSDYVKSAYLDIDNTNFKWCFDLKVPVFTTRLVVTTHIEIVGNSYVFLIDSMNIGKLNAWSMLQSGGYISDDGFTSLFYHASLPIESDLEHGYFLYNPTKFISMFNLGEVTSELFTLVNSPERLSVETDSIGFKLNLEGIRVASPAETDTYDVPGELESALLNKPLNTLNIGEETTVFSVNQENFSKWIHDWYTKDVVIEEIQSNLVNTKIQAKVVNVGVDFTNNHFKLVWTLKLGNIYFNVSEDLELDVGTYEEEFKNVFERPAPSKESTLQKLLMDDFIEVASNKGYLNYLESNRLITFNFESVFDNTSLSSYFSTTWRYVTLSNNTFEFKVTRLM